MANFVDNGDGTWTDLDTGRTVDDQGNLVSGGGPTAMPLPSMQPPGTMTPPGTTMTTTAGPSTSGSQPSSPVLDLLKMFGVDTSNISPSTLAAFAQIPIINSAADKLSGLGNSFQKTAEGYAGQLDPFGSQRAQYQQKLAAIEADPTQVENTPGYQFALKQGLGAVAARDNRAYGLGAGSTSKDYMDYAEGLASKTYNDTITQLSQLSGSQFGPGQAGVLTAGLGANVAAQTAALNAKTSALTGPLGTNGPGVPKSSPTPSGTGGPPVTVNAPGVNVSPGTTVANNVPNVDPWTSYNQSPGSTSSYVPGNPDNIANYSPDTP